MATGKRCLLRRRRSAGGPFLVFVDELGTILRQNGQIDDDPAISDAIQAPEPRW